MPPFAVTRLDHVSVLITDMARCRAFLPPTHCPRQKIKQTTFSWSNVTREVEMTTKNIRSQRFVPAGSDAYLRLYG